MDTNPASCVITPYRHDTAVDVDSWYMVAGTTYSGARFLSESFKLIDVARSAMLEYSKVVKGFGGGRVAIYEFTPTGHHIEEYNWV